MYFHLYLGMKLLGHRVTLLTPWGMTDCFHTGILHSPQEHMKVLTSAHSQQLLSLSDFSSPAILVALSRYSTMVLISLRNNDAECLFMCFLAICTFSLEKSLFKSSAHFLTGLLIFFIVEQDMQMYT